MNIEDLDFTMHGRFLGENILKTKTTWEKIDANRYLSDKHQEAMDYLNPNKGELKEEDMPYLLFKSADGRDFTIRVSSPMEKMSSGGWSTIAVDVESSYDGTSWKKESNKLPTISSKNGQLYIRGTNNVTPNNKELSGRYGIVFMNTEPRQVIWKVSYDGTEYLEVDKSVDANIKISFDSNLGKQVVEIPQEKIGDYTVVAREMNETFPLYEIDPAINLPVYIDHDGNRRLGEWEDLMYSPKNPDVECYGNIESFVDYKTVENGQHPKLGERQFAYFFPGAFLTKSPALPSLTLSPGCYEGLFSGNTKLKKAPLLPATNLAAKCYSSMFEGCSSLTEAPKLLATKLAEECFNMMFYECRSLVSAPEFLVATDLPEKCYSLMFRGCTSLEGKIHCPKSTADNNNKLVLDASSKATVVFDL